MLWLGSALDIGCGPGARPTPKPPPVATLVSQTPQEARDGYLDLSAIARTLALPAVQQEAIWRTWAREHSTDDRQRIALGMLARRADPADVSIILDAYERGTPRLRRLALSALLVFGPDLPRSARERLWSAMLNAAHSATPELIWALVSAGDPRVYELALREYARDAKPFASVRTLDGMDAFDAAMVGALNLDQTLRLAQSSDSRLRLLVAETCSRVAQTECTPWLLHLVRDPVPGVSAAAAPGLAKIGSVETHEALTQALRASSGEHRARLLNALRDGAGLAGLLAALDGVSPDPEQGLAQSAAILAAILGGQAQLRTTLDPRGPDALHEYMQQAPHLYSRTWAAIALARLGDLRALPALAARLRMTPDQAYPGDTLFERSLRRDDSERVTIARAVSDLADAYPEQRSEIRRTCEDALLAWLRQRRAQHPSALRALAKMRSPTIIARLRNWASLTTPLPKPNDDMTALFRHDWPWAMESLQALGWARDTASLPLLHKSLRRKPKDMDLTAQGLAADPNHPRAIALRLLDSGAISGIAEMGDSRGAEPLFSFADDPLENEVSRSEACRALGWVASERDRERVLQRVEALRNQARTDSRFACFLEMFAARAAADLKPALVRLLEELAQDQDVSSAFLVARALGRIGITEADESRVISLLQRDDQSALPAALALLVGARPEMAQLVGLRMLGRPAVQLEQLKTAYVEATAYISEEDLPSGALYRWVSNAFAVAQAGPNPMDWPREALTQSLGLRLADRSPHPMSSLQFRMAAYQGATEGNLAAIEGLLAAGESGVLLAVSETPGPSSHAAYRAYRRLLHTLNPHSF